MQLAPEGRMIDMKRFTVIFLFMSVLLPPLAAQSFCGFFVSGADANLYNEASQVAHATRESDGHVHVQQLSRALKILPWSSPCLWFSKRAVRTLPHNVFEKIDKLMLHVWSNTGRRTPVSFVDPGP